MPTRVVSQPLNMPTARPVARPARTPASGPADVDRHGDRDGGKPRDGAHRQVDLARREHEGHGDRHHRDHRRLADDVEEVVGVEEPLVVQRRGEHEEDDDEADVDDVSAASRRSGLAATGARSSGLASGHRTPPGPRGPPGLRSCSLRSAACRRCAASGRRLAHRRGPRAACRRGPAVRHDHDAVAGGEQLRELRGDHDDRLALAWRGRAPAG